MFIFPPNKGLTRSVSSAVSSRHSNMIQSSTLTGSFQRGASRCICSQILPQGSAKYKPVPIISTRIGKCPNASPVLFGFLRWWSQSWKKKNLIWGFVSKLNYQGSTRKKALPSWETWCGKRGTCQWWNLIFQEQSHGLRAIVWHFLVES